ncbi:hypothetical protein B0T14DRAFT_258636 [Immersiella caudata]|uniref:Protein N-terminal and lysine N-methyltransferase EFM7 n=1 Tax=Immersiella caudata TaxID=314043 RepID=A0AA39WKK2_9PEZI|nr:hypothetical protein B0T14DRAFT_258636 [Immersiella caudata]
MSAAPPTPPAAAPAPVTEPEAEAEAGFSLFDDPEDYYPPSPPPTTQQYTTTTGIPIALHLVGHSPLEAHHLWNGSRVVASHFESHPDLVKDRTVLELGAGAGLPSLVAGALGARKVVVTDFPDPDLVENMRRNVRECTLLDEKEERVVADGYVWGTPAEKILAHIQRPGHAEEKFDVLVLADLLFRHTEHDHLLDSIEMTMKVAEKSKAFVVFTSYRPWLQHKDLKFFDLARDRGFVVEKVLEKKMDRPLFENDPGDEEVRKTVTGWSVTWPKEYVEGRMEWPTKGE